MAPALRDRLEIAECDGIDIVIAVFESAKCSMRKGRNDWSDSDRATVRSVMRKACSMVWICEAHRTRGLSLAGLVTATQLRLVMET